MKCFVSVRLSQLIDKHGYRPNVGIIVANNKSQVLWARRVKQDAWQFPQGGISKAETAISAAKREMFEEVGIKFQSTRNLGETKTWYKYEVPKTKLKPHFKKRGIVGQKQKWFMFKLKNPIIKVSFENNPDDEFRVPVGYFGEEWVTENK